MSRQTAAIVSWRPAIAGAATPYRTAIGPHSGPGIAPGGRRVRYPKI